MTETADNDKTIFEIVAERYGEEAAINVGIVLDPDTFELDDEWFKRARPASEVHPEFVEQWRRSRGRKSKDGDAPEPEAPSMTMFRWIAERHGEEAAINAGIAADPDTFELDDEWFKRARPASEVHPEFVEQWRRSRGRKSKDDDAPEPEAPSMTMFRWIAERHGEEAAINAVIAAYPDTFEADDEWFRNALHISQVDPEFYEQWKRSRGRNAKFREFAMREFAMVDIDIDLVKHFRNDGGEWAKRLNAALRQAVFGDGAGERRDAAAQSRKESV